MNDPFDSLVLFGHWLEKTNLLTVAIFLVITIFLITMLLKAYKHAARFVRFVETLQELPSFMDQTNAKFLVLFEHLNIDPDESKKFEEHPEVPGGDRK